MEMDINSLRAQINEHPGKKAHDRWSNLNVSYNGVYKVNRQQLLAHLDSPNHNHELFDELWQNVRPQHVKQAYQGEYIRLLHNYIAAGSSLIDHSRRFIKEYANSEFVKAYEQKRKEIADTFEHSFLVSMRNYIVHRDIPPIGWRMKITESTDTDEYEATLSVPALLEWGKWSALVRQKLQEAVPTLALVPLITRHGTMIDEFYEWIFGQFKELHGQEIEQVNELIQQLRGPAIPNET